MFTRSQAAPDRHLGTMRRIPHSDLLKRCWEIWGPIQVISLSYLVIFVIYIYIHTHMYVCMYIYICVCNVYIYIYILYNIWYVCMHMYMNMCMWYVYVQIVYVLLYNIILTYSYHMVTSLGKSGYDLLDGINRISLYIYTYTYIYQHLRFRPLGYPGSLWIPRSTA